MPNAESALNEEAGKLLLEQYDDYCRRAKMMTEIHAAPSKRAHEKNSAAKSNGSTSTDLAGSAASSSSANGTSSSTGSSTAGSAAATSVAAKKAKVKVLSRDRRRTLKRL